MESEKRLINGDELYDRITDIIKDVSNYYWGDKFDAVSGRIIDAVLDAPTVDAVEVVRCSDCEHGVYDGWVCGGAGFMMPCHPTFPGHFCACGKRRNDEKV